VWLRHCACVVDSVRSYGKASQLAIATHVCNTDGPSVHVKTWLKPHERTSLSACLRDLAMVSMQLLFGVLDKMLCRLQW
jgi:hypothetical protein